MSVLARQFRGLVSIVPYLHGDLAVVYQDLSRQKVGTDCGLVAGAELLVDLFEAAPCQNHRLIAHRRRTVDTKKEASVHIGSSSWSCRRRYRPG